MGNTFDRVLPDLYIGGIQATDEKVIKLHGFTHVVSACDRPECRVLGVEYLVINVLDMETESISPHFSKAIDFIHNARKNNGVVLVHCMAGISRSSSITLAYLLAATSLNLDQCYNALRAARRIVQPNEGFWKQLVEFEKTELAAHRARLHPPNPKDEETLHALLSGAVDLVSHQVAGPPPVAGFQPNPRH